MYIEENRDTRCFSLKEINQWELFVIIRALSQRDTYDSLQIIRDLNNDIRDNDMTYNQKVDNQDMIATIKFYAEEYKKPEENNF